MRRRKGTKATQGINGDAAALERWTSAPLASRALVGEPCPYESHRPTDWVTPTSQVICGVCHPPAAEFDGIRRRGEEDFDELALEARGRVIPREDRHVDDAGRTRLALDLEEAVDLEEVAPALRDLLPNATRTLEAGLEAIAPAALGASPLNLDATIAAQDEANAEAAAELDAGLDAALEVDP